MWEGGGYNRNFIYEGNTAMLNLVNYFSTQLRILISSRFLFKKIKYRNFKFTWQLLSISRLANFIYKLPLFRGKKNKIGS
jgi:hypothetical protein